MTALKRIGKLKQSRTALSGFPGDRIVCAILRGFDPSLRKAVARARATPFNSAGKQSCANSAISLAGSCHANAASSLRRAN